MPVERRSESPRALHERQTPGAAFERVLEIVPDAMVVVDGHGRIVYVNGRTEKLFGHPRRRLLGRSVETLLPKRFRGRRRTHPSVYFTESRSPGMGIGRELYALRRDGTEFPVEISLSSLETWEGKVVLSSIRDVSEQKRAEAALVERAKDLERSNGELEQFAYLASHDLQEPLRMVSSFVRLLAEDFKGKLGPDADEYIGFALDGASRMQQLIRELLEYARVGRDNLDVETVDVEALVAELAKDLEPTIREARAEIRCGRLPKVRGNGRELRQVMLNLLSNAIKFRGDRPAKIQVGAAADGPLCRFTVRDHGIGIAAEHHERIFGIFQRLHARSQYPGTGIGLAICKKIVERHGGRMGLESKIGDGSTFWFTLPAAVA
jgi:PAS domain S-box-containing protein